MPRTMCRTSASGCSAVTLIRSAERALSFAKFVSDVLEEDRGFIRRRFTEGDDTDFIFVLCMNNGYRNAFQQAKCDKPALAICETIVLESERRPGEDLLCVNEVDVVSLQITSTFPRIPRESHMQIVYTNLAMRKRSRTSLLMHRTSASDEWLWVTSGARRPYQRCLLAKAWPDPDFR
jgi:hypothetical protein